VAMIAITTKSSTSVNPRSALGMSVSHRLFSDVPRQIAPAVEWARPARRSPAGRVNRIDARPQDCPWTEGGLASSGGRGRLVAAVTGCPSRVRRHVIRWFRLARLRDAAAAADLSRTRAAHRLGQARPAAREKSHPWHPWPFSTSVGQAWGGNPPLVDWIGGGPSSRRQRDSSLRTGKTWLFNRRVTKRLLS
jgi:hypothetical protein